MSIVKMGSPVIGCGSAARAHFGNDQICCSATAHLYIWKRLAQLWFVKLIRPCMAPQCILRRVCVRCLRLFGKTEREKK